MLHSLRNDAGADRSAVARIPRHIAVAPNGHRRVSEERGIPLNEVYILGAQRVLEMMDWSMEVGAQALTFYGLSGDNAHRRKSDELDALMEGAIFFADCALEQNLHVHAFGDLKEFADEPKYEPLMERLAALNSIPHGPDDFVIHVAVNYIGTIENELGPLRQAIVQHGMDEVFGNPGKYILSAGVTDIDLFVRPGGEHRTSRLCPFQLGYAELLIWEKYWVDATKSDFLEWVAWFGRQNRKFGK